MSSSPARGQSRSFGRESPAPNWSLSRRTPDALRPGAFGILEPPEGRPETLDEDDLVLVSGLAFDDDGFRLGRGRGFYDRALATGSARKAFRLGVGYAFQWCPRIPREEWDLSVHAGITEEGLREVRRQGT